MDNRAKITGKQGVSLQTWASLIQGSSQDQVLVYNKQSKKYETASKNPSNQRHLTRVSNAKILRVTEPLLARMETEKADPEQLRRLKTSITTIDQNQHKGLRGAISRLFEKLVNWFDHRRFESHARFAERLGEEMELAANAVEVSCAVDSALEALPEDAVFEESHLTQVASLIEARDQMANLRNQLSQNLSFNSSVRENLSQALQKTEAIKAKLTTLRPLAMEFFDARAEAQMLPDFSSMTVLKASALRDEIKVFNEFKHEQTVELTVTYYSELTDTLKQNISSITRIDFEKEIEEMLDAPREFIHQYSDETSMKTIQELQTWIEGSDKTLQAMRAQIAGNPDLSPKDRDALVRALEDVDSPVQGVLARARETILKSTVNHHLNRAAAIAIPLQEAHHTMNEAAQKAVATFRASIAEVGLAKASEQLRTALSQIHFGVFQETTQPLLGSIDDSLEQLRRTQQLLPADMQDLSSIDDLLSRLNSFRSEITSPLEATDIQSLIDLEARRVDTENLSPFTANSWNLDASLNLTSTLEAVDRLNSSLASLEVRISELPLWLQQRIGEAKAVAEQLTAQTEQAVGKNTEQFLQYLEQKVPEVSGFLSLEETGDVDPLTILGLGIREAEGVLSAIQRFQTDFARPDNEAWQSAVVIMDLYKEQVEDTRTRINMLSAGYFADQAGLDTLDAPAAVARVATQPDTATPNIRAAEEMIYHLVYGDEKGIDGQVYPDIPLDNDQAAVVGWHLGMEVDDVSATLAFSSIDDKRAAISQAKTALGRYLAGGSEGASAREFIASLLAERGIELDVIEGAFVQFDADFGQVIPPPPTRGGGLTNLGCTCYLNAELQMLRATPGFVDNLRLMALASPLHQHLLGIMEKMETGNTLSREEMRQFFDLCKARGWWAANSWEQMDSNEFNRWLLNALDISQTTLIVEQTRRYEGVDEMTTNLEATREFQAEIPSLQEVKRAANRIVKLRRDIPGIDDEALIAQLVREHYSVANASMALELMPADNQMTKAQIERIRQLRPITAGELLSWSQTKYLTGEAGRAHSKTTTTIKQAGPYIWQPMQRWIAQADAAAAFKNKQPIQLDEQIIVGEATYQPSAMVIHSGGLGGGHYFSVVKHGDKWYEYNDSAAPREVDVNSPRYSTCAVKILWRRVENRD